MSSDAQETPPAPAPPAKSFRAIAKWIGTAVLTLLGIVLLIATKSTAGSALILAAALALLPLQRLATGQHLARWAQTGLICLLVALALFGIADTDVPPDQAKTGIKFLDQVLAIWRRFEETAFGKS